MDIRYFISLMIGIVFLSVGRSSGQTAKGQTGFPVLSDYNVVWQTPGKNSLGSMSAGNGDIGINAWTEDDGDLLFYLSKTDAWSGNGRLLKLGKIRISISPNPFIKGTPFLQTLDLQDGIIQIKAGEKEKEVDINLWVDAHHPVVDVDIKSKQPVKVTARFETWRNKPKEITNPVEKGSAYGISDLPVIYVEKDSILHIAGNEIVWLHRNKYSIWKENLQLQALGKWASNHQDPLFDRTFGGGICSPQMMKINDETMETKRPVTLAKIQVYALTKQTQTINDWIQSLQKTIHATQAIRESRRLTAHKQWWQQFWNRSYIYIKPHDSLAEDSIEKINSGYILQRYMNACAGRGNAPIKFNGSIFTVDTKHFTGSDSGFDADYRRWGGAYWWQNTRLIYWPMLMCGDFDLMRPFFNMYFKCLPLRKAATRIYYHHGGAFYPETIYFWGTYIDENYGRNRKGKPDGLTDNQYIRRNWQGVLEMSMIMLDYYDFTRDNHFATDTLIPFASAILKFYDEHWPRKNGKLHFDPAQSIETYWKAVNPMAAVAGIKQVATRMLRLDHRLTSTAMRKEWRNMLNDLPPVPEGKDTDVEKILLPAASYSDMHNLENPELYAIFPYRLYGIGKPELTLAIRTFHHRIYKQTGGWQQNAIQAAMLGLTNVAMKDVMYNFSETDKDFRFQAMWGPDYDWVPSQDNGAVAMLALQYMLMQYDSKHIYLLPAWPKDWDASFKLHGPGNTVITGTVKDGEMVQLNVKPASRRKDIVFGDNSRALKIYSE